jgi:hypothetical protein
MQQTLVVGHMVNMFQSVIAWASFKIIGAQNNPMWVVSCD